ncbi:hypothetical protein HDZ31DRAFT_31811 [Schizophyllum fasciatum]
MSFDDFQSFYAPAQGQSSMVPSQFPLQGSQQQPRVQQPQAQANWHLNGAFYASQTRDMQNQQALYSRQGPSDGYNAPMLPFNAQPRMLPQMQAPVNARYYRPHVGQPPRQQQLQQPQPSPLQQFSQQQPKPQILEQEKQPLASPPPPPNEPDMALQNSCPMAQSSSIAPTTSTPSQEMPSPVTSPAENTLPTQIHQIIEQLSVIERDAEIERECTKLREEALQNDIKALQTELTEKTQRFQQTERMLYEQITVLRNQLCAFTQVPPLAWSQPQFAAPRLSNQPGMPPLSPVSLPSVSSPYAGSPAMRHQPLAAPPIAGFPSSHQQMMRTRPHESSPLFAVAQPPTHPQPQSQQQQQQQQQQQHFSSLMQPAAAPPQPSPVPSTSQVPMHDLMSQFTVDDDFVIHSLPPPVPSSLPESRVAQSTLGKRKSETHVDMEGSNKKPAPAPAPAHTPADALIAHTLRCMAVAKGDPLPDEPTGPWSPSEPVRFEWSASLRRSKHNLKMVRRVATDLVQNRASYPSVPAGELEDEEALVEAMAGVFELLRETYKQQARTKRRQSQGKASKVRR